MIINIKKETHEDNTMTLFEGEKDLSYEIKGIHVEENINRRLEAMGMNDKTVVNILNKKRNGAMIIKVRGTRLALGKQITCGIEVSEVTDEKN